ncbi:MAG: adaptor protein MecA [Ruminococcaceae bacterium]|nr:adaptor protein MecA [Oscillospiraceae bacterium]
MELIPINESKLKIMLDESDMKEYNIGDEADCANQETRLAIRHILDRAKSQIGFDTEGSEIFVQLYTSKRGGCELFITKGSLSPNTDTLRQADKRSKKGKREECKALTVRGEAQMGNGKNDFGRMVFSFETLGDLCAVCRILAGLPFAFKSHAYRDECDVFFLVLENTNISAYTRLDRLTFILEYGSRERADHTSTYLFEHAKPICHDNAVATLALF